MTITLADRVQNVKPSATLALGARVNQLKAEGKNIINLTVGEPDFDTPEHIKQAAVQALRDGHTKYTAADGIAPLKQAIIEKFARQNQLQYSPKQIIVSNGIKQCIYNLMQVLLNHGDEVIIPAPYWVSYPEMALLAEATPVFIPSTIENDFKISADQLAASITPKTKLLILNSPSNPSGKAYSKQELAKLAAVLMKNPQVFILSDDMYEEILWTAEPFVNIVNACPELIDRTIVCNGVSKSYAMTGWRIGYAGGPETLIRAMAMVQSQATSNPNSIAQYAALAAITGDQQCVHDMNQAYHERHNMLYEGLQKISGFNCLPSDGTFYCFPSVQKILDKHPQCKTDLELAEFILQEANVAVMPGSPFGAAGCLRFSFATNLQDIRAALTRLENLFP